MNLANRKLLIVSALIFLLAVILGGWFLLFRDKKTPEGSQNKPVVGENTIQKPEDVKPSPVDTSSWKTYRNEEYGFELKYPENWSLMAGAAGYDTPIHLFNDNKNSGRYFCLDINVTSLGSSWLYRMSDFDKKRIFQKDSFKTAGSQDFSLIYFGDGMIANTMVSSTIPMEVPPRYEIDITASFNCVQADYELLEGSNEKMSESSEFKMAVDIIKTIRSIQKPKMVWYKIPELKVELQVEKNVADNIGYRDWYVENDKVGYELYAKNTPEIRGGFKNDSFAKITGYFDYKTDPHIMGWAIACTGNSCCFSNPSTQKLLIKTDTAIICYSDDSFSKELNQQNGVANKYDPITEKLFDGYLKNVSVREMQ